MKKLIAFMIALLLCVMIFCAGVMAKAGEADEAVATEAETTAAETEAATADAGAPDDTDEEKTFFQKFGDAIVGAIDGQKARDTVVTVVTLALGVLAFIFRRTALKVFEKLKVITSKNGEKTNELIGAVNGNADKIDGLLGSNTAQYAELTAWLEGMFGGYSGRLSELEKAVFDARDAEREKNTKIDLTSETVISLADMIMTIYSSSTTIPDAAKEIMREKYARVLHSVNAAEYGETENDAGKTETEAEDGDKT